MALQLGTLLGQAKTDTVVTINERKIRLDLNKLASMPEAERIRLRATKSMMDNRGGRFKSPADMMPDFENKEKDDIELAKLAVNGWDMTKADVAHFLPDPGLQENGAKGALQVAGLDEPVNVVIASANTRKAREMAYNWNKRALRNNQPSDFIPPPDKQVDVKVDRLVRLMKSWDIKDGEANVPLQEGYIRQVAMGAKDLSDAFIDFAEDDLNYCQATQLSPEELEALAQEPYPFTPEN